MEITVDIPDALVAKARSSGLSPEVYAERLFERLAERFARNLTRRTPRMRP